MDDFLLQHAPRAPQPVDEALLEARKRVRLGLAVLASVDDATLERGWPWQGDEADVRYGFYRQLEAFQEARARVRPLLLGAGHHEPPARPLVAMAAARHWALEGLLAGLRDEHLDMDPGNGEWTLRQTLAHIVGGQRAYGWFTCWWLAQRDSAGADFPSQVPDELGELLPEEEAEGVGRLEEIQLRLDYILDLSAGALAGLGGRELAARARWSGVPVTVGFRIGRWSSHMAEHTVQLEKTLDMVGLARSEVHWLVRLVGAAYGQLEEELYMWPSGAEIGSALDELSAAARTFAEDAATIQASARREATTA